MILVDLFCLFDPLLTLQSGTLWMSSIFTLTLAANPSIFNEVGAFLLTSLAWIYPSILFDRSDPLLTSSVEAFSLGIRFLFSMLNQLIQRTFASFSYYFQTGSPYFHFQTRSIWIHSELDLFIVIYLDGYLYFNSLLVH